ncbi:hypothetical protein D5S18_06815 [Nocardia panacis]|uniref:Uncharacterized protein n=1 Tax=Nocardia panacis TaxID=2340916 RepID=A0A3A4KQK8_9NOCA|nr:hypothetical protein [Nocardia panacis]RJO77975.1 hypothetical protein D5S18_06815 [Nocardia panacis]
MSEPACPSCRRAADHCHGALVEHLGRRPECTEPDCAAPSHIRHAFVIDCADLAGGCPCGERDRSAGTA